MTARNCFITLSTDCAFPGPEGRRLALRKTLAELAEIVGESPLSMGDLRIGFDTIAGAYVGQISEAIPEDEGRLIARARTTRQLLRGCEGFMEGFGETLVSRLTRCLDVWSLVVSHYQAHRDEDPRAAAIASTWDRELGFFRAAIAVVDH